MEKEKENKNEYEMPVPEDVKGMHILLVDPDISSLMHTTSMLEDATYKVTGTAVPDVALSMMKERVKQYDMVMVAVQMRGMDCLTFLKVAKTMSNVPVALMSYEEDLQLALQAIQLGACHYFVKPLSRNDIRSLWQFIIRKVSDVPRAIPANEPIVSRTDAREVVSLAARPQDPRGKGKQVMVDAEAVLGHENLRSEGMILDGNGMDADKEIRKRKQSDDHRSKEKGKKKKKKRGGIRPIKKTVKWNPELHAKFMSALMMDSTEGPKEQTCGATDLTDLPEGPSQNQIPKEQHSHLNTNTLVEPSTDGTSVGQQQQQTKGSQEAGSSSSEKGTAPKHAENALQIPEARLGIQSQDIAKTSPVVMATSVGLNVANVDTLTGAGRREYATCRPSFSPRLQLLGSGRLNLGNQITQTGLAARENSSRESSLFYNANSQFGVRETGNKNLEVSQSGGTLMERINQIRRAYRESTESALPSREVTSRISNMKPVTGKAKGPFHIPASSGSQAQGTNDPRQNQNQANYAISLETIESRMSGRKRNYSQYENFGCGLGASSLELVSEQTNLFSNNMVGDIGHIGSSASSMNFGVYPPLNMHQQNPAPTALQYSCVPSEKYAPPFMQNSSNPQAEHFGTIQPPIPNHPITSPKSSGLLRSETMLADPTCHAAQFSSTFMGSREMPFLNPSPNTAQFLSTLPEVSASPFMQNASNLQMESTGFFETLDYPLSSTNNGDLLNSNNMPTGLGSTNQRDALQGVPFDAGLANQAENQTNDFNGENLGGFESINPTEGFQTSAQGSNSAQTPMDDAALDEIFAELRPHFLDADIGSAGFNINNIK